MNICGIIAEYNPFHNGHLYHLEQARLLSEADYTVVVMSGNFVQRGTPALLDKYARTEAALKCGADLVLELPSYYATGSAEYFATGAVNLLEKLGVITHLCFGSECGDTALLQKIAEIFSEEPEAFQETLRRKLKDGTSFPIARSQALLESYPEFGSHTNVLSSPNNILGIEYIKSLLKLNSSIIPLTLLRSGSGYHDKDMNASISSATAIRQAYESGTALERLQSQIPEQAYDVFADYFAGSEPITLNDFSALLHYKLLSEQAVGYTSYVDVTDDLSDRIRKNLYRFTTFSEFCDLLKTKELTYSRISRCLLHILLNMKKAELDAYIRDLDYVPYARILGFRRNSAPLLGEIGKKIRIPLISKLADADKILDELVLHMLQKDILIHDIYSSVLAAKNHSAMKNEYTTPIVIV